jgi:hypothetical protein
MRILGRYYTPARRAAAIIAVFAVAALYAFVAFGAGDALANGYPLPTFQSSPLPGPTPEAWIPTNAVYFPIIMKNAPAGLNLYYPEETPIVLNCANDPCRGDFYRSLVSNTITILNPLAGWASSGCSCGLLDARARGAAIGTLAGMGVKIVGRIFSTIGNVIGSAVTMLFQIVALIQAPAEAIDVRCDAEMELFCVGMAAIMALDEMASGLIMTVTLLFVGIMAFYLISYIITQVREIMQPSGSDE